MQFVECLNERLLEMSFEWHEALAPRAESGRSNVVSRLLFVGRRLFKDLPLTVADRVSDANCGGNSQYTCGSSTRLWGCCSSHLFKPSVEVRQDTGLQIPQIDVTF